LFFPDSLAEHSLAGHGQAVRALLSERTQAGNPQNRFKLFMDNDLRMKNQMVKKSQSKKRTQGRVANLGRISLLVLSRQNENF
jgi:hypothetical protein